MPPLPDTRALTADEFRLARWMLEGSGPQARAFLPQLEAARATTWRCPCGCASWVFHVDVSQPGASPVPGCTSHALCDFFFEDEDDTCGILLTQEQGVLREVHLWSTGDAPRVLPEPDRLHPLGPDAAPAQGQTADAPQEGL